MLASATEEQIDFTEAARTVVGMVHRGLAGDSAEVAVRVEGSTGLVPAQIATSLALAVAELAHNAIEHGFPEDFDVESTANLGLAIVRSIVVDNLHGTISIGGGRSATVTVRFPLALDGDADTEE